MPIDRVLTVCSIGELHLPSTTIHDLGKIEIIKGMEILVRCPLFKGIPYSELEHLLGEVHYQVKKYSKGQTVSLAGDECNALMIMLKGSVMGEMLDPSGKSIKIEDIEPPKPLAIAFIFGEQNRCPVNIVANNDAEILRIPKEEMIKLLQRSPQFLKNFMDIISNRAQFLSDKIRFLSFQTIKGKLANYLLQLAGHKEGEIILPQSQEEMANLFGVTRPSLGRALRELHNDEIIEAKGKSIRIVDRKALVNQLRRD